MKVHAYYVEEEAEEEGPKLMALSRLETNCVFVVTEGDEAAKWKQKISG